MSTATHLARTVPTSTTGTASRPGGATVVRPQSLRTATASEWVKLRTLRSTWVGLASTALVVMAVAALAASVSTGDVAPPGGGGGPGFGDADPVATVLTGADFAVLLMGITGALAGAREHGSRMIAATVAAVPRRWQVVVAKATVFTATAWVTSTVAVLGAFVVGMAVLAGAGAPTVALTDDGVLAEVLGMGAFVTAVGLIGLGLGIVLRSAAGSIGAVVGGVLVVPALAGALLPESWDPVLAYLPSSAAAAFTTVQSASPDVLSPGAGAAVLTAWVVAALGAAGVSITRRDV